METTDLRKLYKALKQAGLQKLELETSSGKVKMCLTREALAGAPAADPEERSEIVAGEEHLHDAHSSRSVVVLSERVGIFVAGKWVPEVGDIVKAGDILGFIKGISIQDQVVCPCDGMILEIQVEVGQIVEFGKALFLIEPGLGSSQPE